VEQHPSSLIHNMQTVMIFAPIHLPLLVALLAWPLGARRVRTFALVGALGGALVLIASIPFPTWASIHTPWWLLGMLYVPLGVGIGAIVGCLIGLGSRLVAAAQPGFRERPPNER